MAPSFKLTYFNLTVRGEPIRMLLQYGGIPFEDKRIEFEDWPKIKQTMPLGQLPVLEIDGKPYTQCIPLCRFIGNLLKIDGKDRLDNLAIDAVVEIFWDLLKTAYERFWDPEEARKNKLKEKLTTDMPILLGKLEENTKKNGGYIALNRITWADIYFLCFYEDLRNLVEWQMPFDNYPNLQQLKKRLLENKNIKEYIKKRPTNKAMSAYDLKSDI